MLLQLMLNNCLYSYYDLRKYIKPVEPTGAPISGTKQGEKDSEFASRTSRHPADLNVESRGRHGSFTPNRSQSGCLTQYCGFSRKIATCWK